MKLSPKFQRWITAGLLLSASTLAFAPVASADSPWRRYKGNGPSRYSGQQRVWVRDHHDSGAGPALAGLIGGFILGAAISHPAPVVVHERVYSAPPRYRYYDPAGERWFDTLDECRSYDRGDRRPSVIQVIDDSDGACVQTLYWQDGGWYNDHGNGGYRENDSRNR